MTPLLPIGKPPVWDLGRIRHWRGACKAPVHGCPHLDDREGDGLAWAGPHVERRVAAKRLGRHASHRCPPQDVGVQAGGTKAAAATAATTVAARHACSGVAHQAGRSGLELQGMRRKRR